MNPQKSNEQHWQLLVLLLKELAIQKYGTGYQTRIAERSGMYQNHVSRFFSLKYVPKLSTFLIIAKSIKVNFFFKDQEEKSDLNIAFENAMDQLGRRPAKLPKN